MVSFSKEPPRHGEQGKWYWNSEEDPYLRWYSEGMGSWIKIKQLRAEKSLNSQRVPKTIQHYTDSDKGGGQKNECRNSDDSNSRWVLDSQ